MTESSDTHHEDLAAPKEKKRSWYIPKDHVLRCFPSPADDCAVASLWSSSASAGFFDADLEQATDEINATLQRVAMKSPSDALLSFIVVGARLFLVWTRPSKSARPEPGDVGPHNDAKSIAEVLRLKGKPATKRTYWINPDRGVAGCYTSDDNRCIVSNLWEATEAAGSFHDAALAEATGHINGVLRGVKERQKERTSPSLLLVESRPLLAWTVPVIGPHDDPQALRGALLLKDSF